MKTFRKCVVWREGRYSTFSDWIREEETELEGPVRSEESQGEYSIVKAEWGVPTIKTLVF